MKKKPVKKVTKKRVTKKPVKKIAKKPVKKVAKRKVTKKPVKKVTKKPVKKIAKKPVKKLTPKTSKGSINAKKSVRTSKIRKRKSTVGKKQFRRGRKQIQSRGKQRSNIRRDKKNKIPVRRARKATPTKSIKRRKVASKPARFPTVTKYKLQSIKGRILKREPKAKEMLSALEKSANQLKLLEPTILGPHVNKDGSIDGEIRVVVTGDYRAFFRRLIRYYPRMRGAWIIFIVFFEPDIENFYDLSDFYVRRGLAGIPIHSALADDRGAVKGLYARMISERVEEGSGFRPIEIAMRLHWNKNRQRPRY